MGGVRKGKGGSKEAKPVSATKSNPPLLGSSNSNPDGEVEITPSFVKECRGAQNFDPELSIEAKARGLEKLPACSQRNHAQGRSLLIYMTRRLTQRLTFQQVEVRQGLRYLIFTLRKGLNDYNSLPCALLLARVLNNFEGQHFPFLIMAYDAIKFVTDADSRPVDDWADPKEGVISYIDNIHKVFGEEVAGFTPSERRQNGCHILKLILAELSAKNRSMGLSRANWNCLQEDNGEVEWGLMVLSMMANDREIMPGKRKKARDSWQAHFEAQSRSMNHSERQLMEIFHQKMGRTEPVKEVKKEEPREQKDKVQERHLAVVNGEIKYSSKGGGHPVPSFNKQDLEEFGKLLKEKLLSVPQAERRNLIANLLSIDRREHQKALESLRVKDASAIASVGAEGLAQMERAIANGEAIGELEEDLAAKKQRAWQEEATVKLLLEVSERGTEGLLLDVLHKRLLEPCNGYNQEIPDISIKDYSSPEEWFDLLLEFSKKIRAGRRTDCHDLHFINASGFLDDDMIGAPQVCCSALKGQEKQISSLFLWTAADSLQEVFGIDYQDSSDLSVEELEKLSLEATRIGAREGEHYLLMSRAAASFFKEVQKADDADKLCRETLSCLCPSHCGYSDPEKQVEKERQENGVQNTENASADPVQVEIPTSDSSPKGEREKCSHVGCSQSFLTEESKLGVGNEDRETRVIVENILDALRMLQKAEALSLIVMHLLATFIQGALRSKVNAFLEAKVKESGPSVRFFQEVSMLENITWEHLSLIDKASLVKLEEMVLLILGKQLNLTNLSSGTGENAAAMRLWYECKQLDIFDRCSTSAIRRVQAAELYTSHVMFEDTKPKDLTSQNGPAPNEQAAPLNPDQQADQGGEVAEASAGATAASTGATAPSPRIGEEDTAFSDKAVVEGVVPFLLSYFDGDFGMQAAADGFESQKEALYSAIGDTLIQAASRLNEMHAYHHLLMVYENLTELATRPTPRSIDEIEDLVKHIVRSHENDTPWKLTDGRFHVMRKALLAQKYPTSTFSHLFLQNDMYISESFERNVARNEWRTLSSYLVESKDQGPPFAVPIEGSSETEPIAHHMAKVVIDYETNISHLRNLVQEFLTLHPDSFVNKADRCFVYALLDKFRHMLFDRRASEREKAAEELLAEDHAQGLKEAAAKDKKRRKAARRKEQALQGAGIATSERAEQEPEDFSANVTAELAADFSQEPIGSGFSYLSTGHDMDEDWTEVPIKTKSSKGKGTSLEADPPPSTPEPPETPPSREATEEAATEFVSAKGRRKKGRADRRAAQASKGLGEGEEDSQQPPLASAKSTAETSRSEADWQNLQDNEWVQVEAEPVLLRLQADLQRASEEGEPKASEGKAADGWVPRDDRNRGSDSWAGDSGQDFSGQASSISKLPESRSNRRRSQVRDKTEKEARQVTLVEVKERSRGPSGERDVRSKSRTEARGQRQSDRVAVVPVTIPLPQEALPQPQEIVSQQPGTSSQLQDRPPQLQERLPQDARRQGSRDDMPRGCLLCHGYHNYYQCGEYKRMSLSQQNEVKDRFYALRGGGVRRVPSLRCFMCGDDHLIEKCPAIPSGTTNQERRQLVQVCRDGNESRKNSVLNKILNRLQPTAASEGQQQDYRGEPGRASGWQADEASSKDAAAVSSYAARARQASVPLSPKTGPPSRQGPVPPSSTHPPQPHASGRSRVLSIPRERSTDADLGPNISASAALPLPPPPAATAPPQFGTQDHAAELEAGFRNQWPSVNQWDQKTHGATSVPVYTEEGYHGYPSGLHAQQQQPEISQYDFHYQGRQDSGSRDSVDSKELEEAASFASQGSQSLAVGQQGGQQQYRPYQAEGAARSHLEAAPESAEEQRKERLYGHQHQSESQGRQAPPGFDHRSTAPPQLTEPPPLATAAARGRLGPLPLQRPKPGPSPPISPAHARTQPGAMPPARPAVRSQRVPAAAIINTAPPAVGLTRPQLQPPIPLVKADASQKAGDTLELDDYLSALGLDIAPPENSASAAPAVPSYSAMVGYDNQRRAPSENEDEDEELQKVLQASISDTRMTHYPPDGFEAATGLSDAQYGGILTPGLQNNVGEYNCFLNCILQCLWHCTEFRARIQRWDTSHVKDSAVVSALIDLFKSFEAEESQQSQPGKRRQAISPAALRKALHACCEERFRLGEMSDASEVLSAIYESLEGVAGGDALVHELFQWQVHEYVSCDHCQGRLSHSSKHSQFFYHTSATALRNEMAEDIEDGVDSVDSLGSYLARVERQMQKTCDEDEGGCGRLLSVEYSLQNTARPAQVFTLQLGWQKEHESSSDILNTMTTISEEVDVAEVFNGGRTNVFVYSLHCMVCYYGLHYQAFVKDSKSNVWRMFDDTTTSEIGDWKAVQEKCHVGRIQPSVLFYEAAWRS